MRKEQKGDESKMLRLRKSKLLPQQVSDLGAFIFVVAMIPVSRNLPLTTEDLCPISRYQVTYLWEVIVVSPALFPEQEQVVVPFYGSQFSNILRLKHTP